MVVIWRRRAGTAHVCKAHARGAHVVEEEREGEGVPAAAREAGKERFSSGCCGGVLPLSLDAAEPASSSRPLPDGPGDRRGRMLANAAQSSQARPGVLTLQRR